MNTPTLKQPLLPADRIPLEQSHHANGTSPERREPVYYLCPRLGIAADPDTAYNFPAELNHCYQVRPVTPVHLHHQINYCLSPNHARCPLYRQQAVVVLPAKRSKRPRLRLWQPKQQQPRPSRPHRPLLRLIPILFFVAAAFLLAAGWYYRDGLAAWLPPSTRLPAVAAPLASPTAPAVAIIPTATDTPTLTPSPTPTHTATPTTRPSATSTRTPSPSPSPSATQSPLYTLQSPTPSTTQSPISTLQSPTPAGTGCPPPAGWVLYTVQPNDSLFRLGQRFGLPYAELQLANCMGTSKAIYVGQQLYVPAQSPTATPPLPAGTPSSFPGEVES
jgi:LysM repeat protein